MPNESHFSKVADVRWLIPQIAGAASKAFTFSNEFQYAYLPRSEINSDALMTKSKGQEIVLHSSGGVVSFLFHTHQWCGSIKIEANGVEFVETLYTVEHSYRSIEIDTGQGGNIRIVTGASRDPESLGDEIWLVAISFSQRQSWDLISRPVSSNCTLTHGRYGEFLTLTKDTVIGSSIVRNGIWAEDDVDTFLHLIKSGMTVLDVGANIGHHTVVYSKIVGDTGRVIAFEPQDNIFKLLASNTVLNDCSNVNIVKSCVGDVEGVVNLFPVDYASPTNYGALGVDPVSRQGNTGQGERCRVATLDKLISELLTPISRCDFMKIDVQTYELFVLRGAEGLLKQYRPAIFLEISPFWMKKYYEYTEIYSFLFGLGYEITHPKDPSVPPGGIKQWGGNENEEWDILAVPKQ